MAASTTKRVLIIDDDDANGSLLVHLLTKRGVQAASELDGAKGLSNASRNRPDLILLDVFMPGMDGYEVLQKLKDDDALKGIPVVMMSIVEDDERRQKALDMGAKEYFPKPFDLHELIGLVLESLGHDQA